LRRVKEKVKEREREREEKGRERKGRKVSGLIEERRSQKEEVDGWMGGGVVMLCLSPLPHGLHVVAWSHFSYVCLSILPLFLCFFLYRWVELG